MNTPLSDREARTAFQSALAAFVNHGFQKLVADSAIAAAEIARRCDAGTADIRVSAELFPFRAKVEFVPRGAQVQPITLFECKGDYAPPDFARQFN